MINFDGITKENMKEHNSNWLQIPDHPYRILKIGGSGSGKANSFNLISHPPDIDKIYLYAKNPFEPEHQLLINTKILMILKHLLNIEVISIIFVKILKNTIQIKNAKH